MRGSPLLKALLVLLAVIASGIGLRALTSQSAPARATTDPPPATPSSGHLDTPFELILSHPARSIRLDPGTDGKALDLPAGPGPHQGRIALDPDNPVIFIDIEWADPAPQGIHRFAKLTLEPPNQPTLSHTFDSTTTLSDVWELGE